MQFQSARNVIQTVRAGGGYTMGSSPQATFGGVGKTGSAALITPRQAGVAIGLSAGRGPQDARIGLMVVVQTSQTQTFLNQMAQLARGQNELDIQHVGPMAATDPPTAPSASYYQQVRRPLEPGVSVGNFRGPPSAGTLGGFVRTPDGVRHILSNNHVLANASMVNAPRAAKNDPVLQPGPYDGGSHQGHHVASLCDWIPIDPQGPNYVDCAVASVPNDWHLITPHNKKRVMGVRAPRLGERVFKVGRSTTETNGIVRMTETDEFPIVFNSQIVYFDEQIAIHGENNRPFSDHGDSGALIISHDDHQAVGLLFAGNPNRTLACPLERVLTELGVELIL
jgi:hypothetical protein